MAILEMNKICIYGLNEQRKAVLEFLHKREVMEISDSQAEDIGLDRQETAKSISQFDSYLASAQQALSILDMYAPEKKGMFSKRKPADESIYSMGKKEIDTVNKHVYDIIRIQKQIKANEDSAGKINISQSQLMPYLSLDVPMNFKGTKQTSVKLGILEGEWSSERILGEFISAELENIHIEILSSSKQQTAVWFIYPSEFEEKYSSFIRTLGMSEPPFGLSHRTAQKKLEKLQEQKDKLSEDNKSLQEEIISYTKHRDEIELFYDHLAMRREKYKALSHLAITENVFIITGYIPKKQFDTLKEELCSRFDVEVTAEEPDEGEAPIAFSNNAFSAPVEGITSDYSMPSPDDIDPNPIMSVFYYFFFGMMFSDAGYGLLMMIACGILGFGNVLERHKRKVYKMFFYCGVSTTFWGLMYGSFFGDMIDTICAKFLNSPFRLTPILLNPTNKPLELLIISVAFGMIHILTALCIKFYMVWRKGNKADAICDTGFWIAALTGLCIFAAGFGLSQETVKTVGIAVTIAGFAGLLVTGGRNSKNIIGKIFGGVLSLYDITSYVGDVLSYSRLMALGLATGVIASVINVLGSLGGNTVIGIISYIVISIFGHALNFAINCLGAYVHTNRLQYVEYYQKFYEGGGRKFKPFSMNTKYYNFSKND